MVSLTIYYLAGIDVQSAFLATSGVAVLTYVVGSASGIRLLKGKGREMVLPIISLGTSLVLLPFIGPLLVASIPVAGLGFAYGRFRKK